MGRRYNRRMRPLATLVLLTPCLACAQIQPEFAYNGVGRAFPVQIKGNGKLELRLLQGGSAEVIETVPAKSGKQDLAKLFPSLWTAKRPAVLYAQLVANGKPKGPALVLRPMVNPVLSVLKPDKTVEFQKDEDNEYAGIHAWVDQDLLLETNLGNMRFRLRPDCAPNTVRNIMDLAKGGYYRDVIWHRIVPVARGNPFVIQGGDPSGTGSGGPGFAYALEDSPLPHDFGVISMARSTDPNTNGSQFFVCLSREGTARLDHKYASFGQLIEGAEVVRKTAAAPLEGERPKNPPTIRRAILVDAAPYSKP
ncbi:peptidylprolyl isomerase [bacterium]|nr:MAG: peptidylprolyl isomerase [bacterium]